MARKLVLHMDINKTVVACDVALSQGPEEALTTYLAGVVWGRLSGGGGVSDSGSLNAGWTWSSLKPSLEPPEPQAISYYQYVESRLTRSDGPGQRRKFHQALGKFISTEEGKQFGWALDELKRELSWTKDVSYGGDWDDSDFVVGGANGQKYHFLLPSFIKLLYVLQERGRDFSVIFRTFGDDTQRVIRCLDKISRGEHPYFRKPLQVKVTSQSGRIMRSCPTSSSGIDLTFVTPFSADVIGGVSTTEDHGSRRAQVTVTGDTGLREMYETFCHLEGVCAVKDDYQHWQANCYSTGAAKPFILDFSDYSSHHIFFDDNVRLQESNNIVDVRVMDGPRSRLLSQRELCALEDVCVVKADLLQSVTDPDYFLDKVAVCEGNYGRFLASYFHKSS